MEVELQAICAHRTVWALNDVVRGVLKCTHFAAVMIAGRDPLWGVFDIKTGKITHYFGSRDLIAQSAAFRNKSWRRKQSTWQLQPAVTEPVDRKASEDFIRAQGETLAKKPRRERDWSNFTPAIVKRGHRRKAPAHNNIVH